MELRTVLDERATADRRRKPLRPAGNQRRHPAQHVICEAKESRKSGNVVKSREFPPVILGTIDFCSGIPGGPAFDNSRACIWTNCPSSNSSCSSWHRGRRQRHARVVRLQSLFVHIYETMIVSDFCECSRHVRQTCC